LSNAYSGWQSFFAPVQFTSNQWVQIALTFSPTNVAFYTNGVLLATCYETPALSWDFGYPVEADPIYEVGNGMVYTPLPSTLSDGFTVGTRLPNGASVNGSIDELEILNYPLTAQAVGAGYPNFGGNTNNMADTNYIGVSDMLQKYVYGLAPSPTNAVPVRLGYWRFDSPLLYSEEGAVPISQSGVTLTPSWSGTALNVGNGEKSGVVYPDVNSNGWANINCQQGTLRFWYKPNAITAPGAPLVYLGTADLDQEWVLWGDASFESIVFDTGGPDNNFSAHWTFSTTNWMQIVLTYGPTSSSLYINGRLVTNGSGVADLPTLATRHLGMVVGNMTGGVQGIKGQFEEMETFNYQLSAGEIWTNFQTVQAVDTDLDGVPDLLEDIHLATSTSFLGNPVVITGTIEAEQFDQGGPGIGYSNNVASNALCAYRNTGMYIAPCDDLGLGYCLDQTTSNEWVNYTIDVLVPGTYTVETRVQGIGTNGMFDLQFTNLTAGGPVVDTGSLTIPTTTWTNVATNVTLAAGTNVMKLTWTSSISGLCSGAGWGG